MKTVRYRDVRIFVVAVLLATAIIGCGSENPITMTGPSPTVSAQNTPTGVSPEIHRSEDGKIYVRKDGWPIPSLDGAEREEFETSLTSGDGRSVKVYRMVIKADPLSLITGNPLHLIGSGSKHIRINAVKEYRTSAGVFCYKFLVNDAEVDENTNKLISTQRFLYPYSLYDEDGDGVFESLVISETDRNGRKGFQVEPHLPEWAIVKDK